MEIVTIGLDCKKAPVEIREKLSFVSTRLCEALTELVAMPRIAEAAILSTCNRVEIYVISEHAALTEIRNQLRQFLSSFHEVAEAEFVPYLFYLNGEAATRHLFEVASGLQSAVLGEPQIQGQVREAIEVARANGSAGRVLDALFRSAISTGKRARTETSISENGVSVSFTAVELLSEKFGTLEGKTALVVGSGKTARLTGQILLSAKVDKLLIINRSLENAYELAARLGVSRDDVYSLERMTEALSEADVVVSSTGAPNAVILTKHVEDALLQRPLRPLGFVDIAVPRDIEPEINKLVGAHIWDIDDIKQQADQNLAKRSNEVGHVKLIVEEELRDFLAWMGALSIVPTITTLRRHADNIRQHELDRVRHAFGNLDKRQLALLDELTSRIVNKLLHEPTLRLKEAASSSDAGHYAEVVQHLFSLQGVQNAAN